MLSNQHGITLPVYNTGIAETQVLAANPNRKKIVYCNPNAAAVIYLSYGRPLPYAQCIPLNPGEKWQDDTLTTQDILFVGSATQNAGLVILEGFGK